MEMIEKLTKIQDAEVVEETLEGLTSSAIKNVWPTYVGFLPEEGPEALYASYLESKGKHERKKISRYIDHVEKEVNRRTGECEYEHEKKGPTPVQVKNQESDRWKRQYGEAVERELEILMKILIVDGLGFKFYEGPDDSGLHYGVKHRGYPRHFWFSHVEVLRYILISTTN